MDKRKSSNRFEGKSLAEIQAMLSQDLEDLDNSWKEKEKKIVKKLVDVAIKKDSHSC